MTLYIHDKSYAGLIIEDKYHSSYPHSIDQLKEMIVFTCLKECKSLLLAGDTYIVYIEKPRLKIIMYFVLWICLLVLDADGTSAKGKLSFVSSDETL